MRRGFARLALAIALVLGAFNAATMSFASAQDTANFPDSQPEYRQKMDSIFELLNRMKDRQIRQDRILGFGFGATVALLVGLGILILSRHSSIAMRHRVAPSEAQGTIQQVDELGGTWATRAIPQIKELGCAWLDYLAKVRLDAHQASLAKRQKGIKSLLSEMESYLVDDLETNRRFQAAVENLVREAERLQADMQGMPKDGAAPRSS
jgi:hypothetical protein